MERLLAGGDPPTAVIASNDLTAIGAIAALHQRGLAVPEDVSVVGFDDIEISAVLHPALTTVRLSRTAIADRAFQALFRAGKRESLPGVEYAIHPELIVRDSTSPPAALRAGRVMGKDA